MRTSLLRLIIAISGVMLPYVVRLPRGMEWVKQYTDTGLTGNLFLGAMNAVAWGSIIAASTLYKHQASVFFPWACGFAVLAWGHYTLDLGSNSTAGIALVVIPVYATVAVGVGALVGLVFDKYVMKPTDT